jgi:hypothetical protein
MNHKYAEDEKESKKRNDIDKEKLDKLVKEGKEVKNSKRTQIQ